MSRSSLQPSRDCRFYGQNTDKDCGPNRWRTGSSPLAGREPLSDRSFSDRAGIAGVANLTGILLREVRYSPDWRSVLVGRRGPVRSRKLSAAIPARGRVLPEIWTQSDGTMHYLDFLS